MGEPTYWPSDPNKTPDLLDFFVYKSIATNYMQIAANWDLSSDHTPIITTLCTHVFCKLQPPGLTTSKTDWNAFRAHTDERIKLNIKLKHPDNIDEAVNSFTCMLQEAAWKSTPQHPPGMTSIFPHLNIYPRISHREEKSKKQMVKKSKPYIQKGI